MMTSNGFRAFGTVTKQYLIWNLGWTSKFPVGFAFRFHSFPSAPIIISVFCQWTKCYSLIWYCRTSLFLPIQHYFAWFFFSCLFKTSYYPACSSLSFWFVPWLIPSSHTAQIACLYRAWLFFTTKLSQYSNFVSFCRCCCFVLQSSTFTISFFHPTFHFPHSIFIFVLFFDYTLSYSSSWKDSFPRFWSWPHVLKESPISFRLG